MRAAAVPPLCVSTSCVNSENEWCQYAGIYEQRAPNCVNMQKKNMKHAYLRALAISIRILSICTSRTTNRWVRCTGATGGNNRFNMTYPPYPHQAAPTHHWSRFANTLYIVCPAVESVQLTAVRTSSENDYGADGSFKRPQARALRTIKWLVRDFFRCRALRHQNSVDFCTFFMLHGRIKSELIASKNSLHLTLCLGSMSCENETAATEKQEFC